MVSSVNWDNGIRNDVGAATWGNGSTGVSGIVSSVNSLVGSTNSDNVGQKVTALSNGNYVVGSPNWDNGLVVDAGAATWGNGSTGTSGVVSVTNSLVGSSLQDRVSSSGITALSNGNYVVGSQSWTLNSGSIFSGAGAATWGNGSIGTRGVISSGNSLIGSSTGDAVGANVTALLINGNYVVGSSNWSGNRGAVTWGNGNGSTFGTVSSTNSLVGSISGDRVGSTDFGSGITALSNGNYVVASSRWNNTSSISLTGAVTWGNGSTGITGTIDSSNSLVGSQFNDRVGNDGITILTNGNYVVRSAGWNGTSTALGAATWGSGATGVQGIVSASNSLVGTNAFDWVGRSGVTALSNGNYVVSSNQWNQNRGAATWGNGATGITGTINGSNSLIGSNINDFVGGNSNIGSSGNGITALTNGNYVVSSSLWNNGSLLGAGAVTWGNGLSGITGIVSTSNSLTGAKANDNVGGGGITALSQGNYVISSPNWDNGIIADAGAATWGNGTTAITGAISSTNSLVGTKVGDLVSGVARDVVDIDTGSAYYKWNYRLARW